MLGFKISINGSSFLNIAILSDTGAISAVTSFAKGLGGKISQNCESVVLECGSVDNLSLSERRINSWPSKRLQLGDKVLIEIVDLDEISKPEDSKIETLDSVKVRKAAYLRQLKDELE